MRPLYALLALAAASTVQPAGAQTYAPGYPVCLHVYGPVTYYDCSYTSIAQCNASASGRAAQCLVNPYLAQAAIPPVPPVSRRPRPIY
jgi:hypothetical protein